jgi:hypothetical protein
LRLAPGLFEFTEGEVRLTVADVEAKGGELRAWVEVHEAGRRLHYGDYNLRGPRTVASMAQACTRARAKLDWPTWLSECCYEVIHDTLEGDPPVELTGETAQPPGWIVDGLVGSVGATSLIGFGQTGKSLLALASALTVCSGENMWLGLDAPKGTVLFLDWEADEATHRWRISQLCHGAGRGCPRGLHYLRPRLPLARAVTAVARHAAQVGATLLIVDSVMLARGGDAFGAESTLGLYAALDRIGIPALLVDHRSKHSDENGDAGPYGSVSNFNSLRLAWGTKTIPTSDGADIRLKKVKANYHGNLKEHAWQLRFTDGNRSARFLSVEPATILTGGEATATDRIVGAMRRAGMAGCSVKELAAEVGSAENTVRALLSKLKARELADTVGGRWFTSAPGQEVAPF